MSASPSVAVIDLFALGFFKSQGFREMIPPRKGRSGLTPSCEAVLPFSLGSFKREVDGSAFMMYDMDNYDEDEKLSL